MAEIGVDQRIGDERPDVGRPAARPAHVGHHARIVARGDEGKEQQELVGLLRRQHEREQEVNAHEHDDQRHHDRWYVEHRFAARLRLVEHVGAWFPCLNKPARLIGQASHRRNFLTLMLRCLACAAAAQVGRHALC